MIVKTSQRGQAGWLAAHLTRTDTNEVVRFIGGRGIVVDDVHFALRQFEAQWRMSGTRARDFLVHGSLSPELPLTDKQWADAWDIYEMQHCLSGQPYIEVEHGKPGVTGRPAHRHRAYYRIRSDGRAVHLSHSYRVNEVIGRLCEIQFAHPLTKGAHNQAVHSYLETGGYIAEAEQLRPLTEVRRPRADRSEAEAQQETRTGSRKATVAEIAMSAWLAGDSASARQAALAQSGLFLARGDRRETLVVIDAEGSVWALNRLLSSGRGGSIGRAAEIRRHVDNIWKELPTVAQARAMVKERRIITPGVALHTGPEETPSEAGISQKKIVLPDRPITAAVPQTTDACSSSDDYWPSETISTSRWIDHEPEILPSRAIRELSRPVNKMIPGKKPASQLSSSDADRTRNRDLSVDSAIRRKEKHLVTTTSEIPSTVHSRASNRKRDFGHAHRNVQGALPEANARIVSAEIKLPLCGDVADPSTPSSTSGGVVCGHPREHSQSSKTSEPVVVSSSNAEQRPRSEGPWWRLEILDLNERVESGEIHAAQNPQPPGPRYRNGKKVNVVVDDRLSTVLVKPAATQGLPVLAVTIQATGRQEPNMPRSDCRRPRRPAPDVSLAPPPAEITGASAGPVCVQSFREKMRSCMIEYASLVCIWFSLHSKGEAATLMLQVTKKVQNAWNCLCRTSATMLQATGLADADDDIESLIERSLARHRPDAVKAHAAWRRGETPPPTHQGADRLASTVPPLLVPLGRGHGAPHQGGWQRTL